jgi:membrane fusion protein (multidrug efflux system)
MNSDSSSTLNHTGSPAGVRLKVSGKEGLRPLEAVLAEPAVASAPKGSFAARRKWLIRLAALVVLATGAVVGVRYYFHSLAWEGTDDAFVEGHVLQISAKISNQVETVLIDDNQAVKKGDLLVKIDDRDYRVALEEAQANYDKARSDFARYSSLLDTHAISKADLDAARASLDVTKARLDQAKLNLDYTEIRAPESGKVTRKNVEPGDYLQIGQTLCAIVPQQFWVLANYKETQLARIRVGQKVVVWVDSLPGRKFAGHVDSLQAGTGSEFSLLPPENATGNYVKVVQRIPVKLVFDEPADVIALLAPGMSVQPEVRVK